MCVSEVREGHSFLKLMSLPAAFQGQNWVVMAGFCCVQFYCQNFKPCLQMPAWVLGSCWWAYICSLEVLKMQRAWGGRLGRPQALSLWLPSAAEWEQEAVRQLVIPCREQLSEKQELVYKCLKCKRLLLHNSFPISPKHWDKTKPSDSRSSKEQELHSGAAMAGWEDWNASPHYRRWGRIKQPYFSPLQLSERLRGAERLSN